MDGDDPKKYTIIENVLQKINQKYVALAKHEKKRNNKLLQVIDRIIQTLRNKSVLFKNLYQNKFYGGSYYDGLKVGSPTEYDIDCLLRLPKIAEPTVVASDKPGYVHIVLNNMKALQLKTDEAPKYVELDKLLNGNRISTKKVKSWMEGLLSSAISGTNSTEIDIDSKTCNVKYTMTKGGPAYTIKLEGNFDGEKFNMDIDLVPCFTFVDDQWPSSGYLPNISKAKKNFFVVPKSPVEGLADYWRLSFQEQERELLNKCEVMKPSIRLIKKIRDRHQHKIASYFIKTVFLLELEKTDKSFWSKSFSFVFVRMLRKYFEYIEQKNIPYYWNRKNNLISDISHETLGNIANKLRRILEHIEKICDIKSDIYDIVPYFLSKDEVEIETFKREVPLPKKLKRTETETVREASLEFVAPLCGSPSSSITSSLEEISKDMCGESSTCNVGSQSLEVLTRIETLLIAVSSGQQRLHTMLQAAMDKIEQCELQIKELKTEISKDKPEQAVQKEEITRRISDVSVLDDTTSVVQLLETIPECNL